MTKKQLVAILIALVVSFAYVRFFTDWFAPESIQIVHTFRPPAPASKRPRRGVPENPNVNTVVFGLNGKFKITEVKVISLLDLATNKYPHALWHLVTDSNSAPQKGFTYGEAIKGMQPKVKGVPAEPLEAGVPYRLILTAEKLQGEYDFKTPEHHPAPAP